MTTPLSPHPRDPLLSFKDALPVLGIGRRKLWSMVNRGEIPHLRVGRLIKFRPSSLEQWLAAAERKEAKS